MAFFFAPFTANRFGRTLFPAGLVIVLAGLLPAGNQLMWWIYALLSAVFAAATTILAKIGIKGVDSDLATAIRTLVIVVMAWSIVLLKHVGKEITGLNRQNWTFLLLSGLATGLSWLFYFKALQDGKVSRVAGIDKASLAIAVVLAVVFLGEQLTLKSVVGLLLMLGGTYLLIR